MFSCLRINDLRLDDENPSIHVIYDGSISLWRDSKNVDVIIVEHDEFSCFELIAFDPFGDHHHRFPSIFVDLVLLRSKVKQELIDRAFQEAERLSLQNEPYNEEQLLKQTTTTLQINTILSRLAITKGDDTSTTLYLKSQLGDCLIDNDVDVIEVTGTTSPNNGPSRLEIAIPMPASLIPTETIIVPPLRNSIFTRCLNSFNGQTSSVAHQVHVASILLQVSNHFVTHMHRNAFLSTLSRPRQRWLKAINKVLHQNLCHRVRIMLAARLQEQDRLKTKHMNKIMRRPPPLLKSNSSVFAAANPSSCDMNRQRCLSPLSLVTRSPPAAVDEERRNTPAKKLLPAFISTRAASAASVAATFSRLERQQNHSKAFVQHRFR